MRARMRIVGIGSVVAMLSWASAAQGATINVKPKPNALQNAIDDAKKGDTLKVKDGVYREDVRVTKPLEILGGDGRPTITGRCDEDIVIDVQSRGVTLEHLKVKGATEAGGPGYTVNFIAVPNGTVDDLTVEQSCEEGDRPQYGINIANSGNIKVLDSRTYGGFRDAGIYVGSISDTRGKTLLIEGNKSDGNNRGIIIEDSDSEDQEIVVSNNDVSDNDATGLFADPAGIYVHNSDNGLYENNTVNENGAFGFDIDAPSDNNMFNGNTATGNGDQDFNDQGSGSCGTGNSFSLPGCI